MLEEIYLLYDYVSNTYHMNFEYVWVHLYLLEVAMLVHQCLKQANVHKLIKKTMVSQPPPQIHTNLQAQSGNLSTRLAIYLL